MNDYIKRSYAKNAICSSCANPCSLVEKANSPCVTIIELFRIPSADVAPVVRCGDCKYLMASGICNMFADDNIKPSASDFCSCGERKDNG